MSYLGAPELILILIILLLLFGVGQIGKIRGKLGKGINFFRHGLKGGEPEEKAVHKLAEKSAGSEKSEDNFPPSS